MKSHILSKQSRVPESYSATRLQDKRVFKQPIIVRLLKNRISDCRDYDMTREAFTLLVAITRLLGYQWQYQINILEI